MAISKANDHQEKVSIHKDSEVVELDIPVRDTNSIAHRDIKPHTLLVDWDFVKDTRRPRQT
jgi:hypothetical protein